MRDLKTLPSVVLNPNGRPELQPSPPPIRLGRGGHNFPQNGNDMCPLINVVVQANVELSHLLIKLCLTPCYGKDFSTAHLATLPACTLFHLNAFGPDRPMQDNPSLKEGWLLRRNLSRTHVPHAWDNRRLPSYTSQEYGCFATTAIRKRRQGL